MEKKKARKKTVFEALALVSVLAVAVGGLWFLAEHLEEGDEVKTPNNPINVNLKIIEGNWIIDYNNVDTLNNTVYKLLIECSKEHNFSVKYTYWQGYDSVFINAINGTQNGEDGKWWQYYVNDEYGDVGCDKKELTNGDYVEWRFEEPGQ
ncbi:MAG: DUF4430 domain-containing protein [Methanomassiliicoccales archaeon]|nr:MAG: DUF4430 domain-containing protein [Methanomassiliicoccales archaeon]